MKRIILILAAAALMMVGCGDEHNSETSVPNGEVITLEGNQTIGYLPNTSVQIINVGEGAYYITCDGSEDCIVHVGDINDDSDNSVNDDSDNSVSTVTDNNSSS